jgi:hypothetical protein
MSTSNQALQAGRQAGKHKGRWASKHSKHTQHAQE